MVSIIICSVSPLLLEDLKQNIAQTIGVEYEIIAIDNREKHWPIAKAYNYGAQQAKYPYLFFTISPSATLSNCTAILSCTRRTVLGIGLSQTTSENP